MRGDVSLKCRLVESVLYHLHQGHLGLLDRPGELRIAPDVRADGPSCHTDSLGGCAFERAIPDSL